MLVFHMQDLDESPIFHACLVCQFPNPRQSCGKIEYVTLLRELQNLKTTDIIDPATKQPRIPDRVWMVTGNTIPRESIQHAQQFMAKLSIEGIKLMDAPILEERLKKKVPTIYLKYCRPADSYDWIASTLLSDHRERNVLDPGTKGSIEDIYVQLDVAPSNGYFRRIITGRLIPQLIEVPSELPQLDSIFINRFLEENHPTAKMESKPGSEELALEIVQSIQSAAKQLRTDFQKIRNKCTTEQLKERLSVFLTRQRRFESDVRHFVKLLGPGLFKPRAAKTSESFSLSNISPVDLLKLEGDVIVYGEPGSGKTFHAKMAFKKATKQGLTVIYYPCAAYRAKDGGIAANIKKFWGQEGVKNSKEIDLKLQTRGACLILDGLDEAVANAKEFLAEIVNIRATHEELKLLLTCRTALELEIRDTFLAVELEGFSHTQLKQFVKKWFGTNKYKSDTLLEFLETHPAIREAASSPMVASVLVVLHEHEYELPNTYAELYRARFDLLFERWDKGKNVARNVFKKDDKLALLQDLAYHVHKRKKRFFTKHEFDGAFNRVLIKVLNHTHCDALRQEILVSNGAILREGPEAYSFGHLSNQEYLAARYISTRNKIPYLAKQLSDPWWSEVAKFFASITGDVSALLKKALEVQKGDLLSHRDLLDELVNVARYTSPAAVTFLTDIYSEDEETAREEEHDEKEEDTAADCVNTLLETEGKDKNAYNTLLELGERAIPFICSYIEREYIPDGVPVSISKIARLQSLYEVLKGLALEIEIPRGIFDPLRHALTDASFIINSSGQRVPRAGNPEAKRLLARIDRWIKRLGGFEE